MWLITLRNQTHSCDALYNAIIYERFMDIAIKVYFADFYEIEVPPCGNTNPIFDMSFCGSDK
jgi:hypothetical protein